MKRISSNKRLSKVFLPASMLLFLCAFTSLLASCFPMRETYYEPSSINGEITASQCHDSVGPKNKINIKIDHDVVLAVHTLLDKNAEKKGKKHNDLIVLIELRIPEDVNAKYVDKEFVVTDLQSSETSYPHPSPIYNISGEVVYWHVKFGNITVEEKSPIPFYDDLKGGLVVKYRGESINEPYSFFIKIENFQSENFSLKLPDILVNKSRVKLPEIIFKKREGVFISPLNC